MTPTRAIICRNLFLSNHKRGMTPYITDVGLIKYGLDIPWVDSSIGVTQLPHNSILIVDQETLIITNDEGTRSVEIPLIWLDEDDPDFPEKMKKLTEKSYINSGIPKKSVDSHLR